MGLVVTGIGTLTSLGTDPDTFFDNLLEGKCGIQKMKRFNPDDYKPVPSISSEPCQLKWYKCIASDASESIEHQSSIAKDWMRTNLMRTAN